MNNGRNQSKQSKHRNPRKGRRKHENPYKQIFLRNNPDYLKAYLDLEKQARTWQGQGQYWLAKECERRMACLLNEDIAGYKVEHHSEKLFHKTKRF
jgi:hypothetical protein